MSKSRGNVVEPWDVIERHGADAFPLVLLHRPAALGRLPLLGRYTVGEAVRQFLLTLWNTYSVLGALREHRGTRAEGLPGEAWSGERGETARRGSWIAGRCPACSGPSPRSASTWTTSTAPPPGSVADYSEELSNWYVRLSRRRFWEADAAAFATLRHCLITLSMLLAPFTALSRRRDLHQPRGRRGQGIRRPTRLGPSLRLPDARRGLIDDELEAGMEAVRRTVELGRAARARAKVKVRQPLRKAVVVASDAERAAIERLSEVVASELNVKEIEFVHEEAELVSYRVKTQLPRARPALRQGDAPGRRRGRALWTRMRSPPRSRTARSRIAIDGPTTP